MRHAFRARALAGVALAMAYTWASPSVHARRGAPPPSRLHAVQPLGSVPQLVLPPLDVDGLLAEDEAAGSKDALRRFALPIDVLATPRTDGAWETLEDGSRLWRLRVHVPGATDLNFGFGVCEMPEGATLHVVSELGGREADHDGPFTAADCAKHGQAWTAVLTGDRATLEVRVPAGADEPALELTRVGAGYRDFHGRFREPIATPKSGACNNDVVCPVGDPWRDEIASVGVYSVQGFMSCTGSMIVDVPRTFRSWFLTANHCLGATDTPTVVVYWNYETTGCGGARDGRLDQFQSGATYRSSLSSSDFHLMELDAQPDPAWNVYWSGWDATDAIAQGTVGIHHPSTDEKAITFNEDPIRTADSCIGGAADSHWWIDQYEDGTTEGGSSGSGLWDQGTRRLIGTLSGGAASCSFISYDCYGRFGVHWSRDARPNRQLAIWLDPMTTGTRTAAGGRPGAACDGAEIAIDTVRVRKGPGTTVILAYTGATSACATGVQVRMAPTARPTAGTGSWPADPSFVDVTPQDVDGGPEFRHVPPAGAAYYLVAESIPTGVGPSGSYGN